MVSSESENNDSPPPFIFSIRFLLALVGCFAYLSQYSQNVDISVAIVCMVNNTALDLNQFLETQNEKKTDFNKYVHQIEECQANNVTHEINDGEFFWDKRIQGMILSSYFIGYALTQIPGAWLAFKFGAKPVLGFSVLSFSMLTLLTPLAANIHYAAVIIIRFTIGVLQGVLWPTFSGFWSIWAPEHERSRLVSISSAGSQLGSVVTLSLSGYLCQNGFAGGWPSIFYVFGSFGVLWSIVWFIISSNEPATNKFISEREKKYIISQTNIGSKNKKSQSIPWIKIFLSRPCLALFVGHVCSDWGAFLFLTCLPTYMKEVLKFDIESNGLLSSIPYLFFWIFQIISGVIGDYMLKKFKFRRQTVRRLFNILGFIIPMLSVIGQMFVDCSSKYIGVVLLTIGFAFTGCQYGAGFLVSYNDVAGVYSGIVFSIANTLGTIPGFLAPYLVGLITKNKTQGEWRIVFGITAVIYLIGCLTLVLNQTKKTCKWAQKEAATSSLEEAGQSATVNEIELLNANNSI